MLLTQKHEGHIRKLPFLHRFLSGLERAHIIFTIQGSFDALRGNKFIYRLKILTNGAFYTFNQIWYRSAQMFATQVMTGLQCDSLGCRIMNQTDER